jgi:large subunit ribosomal protein L22e
MTKNQINKTRRKKSEYKKARRLANKGVKKVVKKDPKPYARTFIIDCAKPAEHNILEVASLEKFLKDSIKVNGKAGALGDSVKVVSAGNRVEVTVVGDFSKRYLKYLTKKYLKKNMIRDYLRVVASSKHKYELKYFRFNDDDSEDEDEEDAEE